MKAADLGVTGLYMNRDTRRIACVNANFLITARDAQRLSSPAAGGDPVERMVRWRAGTIDPSYAACTCHEAGSHHSASTGACTPPAILHPNQMLPSH